MAMLQGDPAGVVEGSRREDIDLFHSGACEHEILLAGAFLESHPFFEGPRSVEPRRKDDLCHDGQGTQIAVLRRDQPILACFSLYAWKQSGQIPCEVCVSSVRSTNSSMVIHSSPSPTFLHQAHIRRKPSK